MREVGPWTLAVRSPRPLTCCLLACALTAWGCDDGDADDGAGGTSGADAGEQAAGGDRAGGDATGGAGGDGRGGDGRGGDGPGGDGPGGEEPGDDPNAPTWHGALQAVFQRNCAACHTVGGVAPFPLDDYENASRFSGAALAAVDAGRMPPWPPDDDCHDYLDVRSMPDADVDLLREWVGGGAPEGTAPDAPPEPPERPRLPEADIIARPSGAYTPDTARPDTYRCFLLDHAFEEETWMVGGWVVPGHVPIVHHVLGFVVAPERVAQMEASDGADGQPGFDCFGGSQGGPIAWWVPGADPVTYENGVAKIIPAGARLMIQVHYNVLTAEPQPDATAFHMITTDERPTQSAATVGLAKRDMLIPAGEPESVQTQTFPNRGGSDWVISEVAGHMHLLGRSIKMEKVRADGSTECLLDIPDWDFNWQTFYRLPEDQWMRVAPGESLQMTCVYDNSPENQPVVNGERLDPRDVRWGEGTLDEMCLTYVTRVEPYVGEDGGGVPPAQVCPEFEVCRAGCEAPRSYRCLMDCSFGTTACGTCLISTFFGDGGCARRDCGREAAAASPCYQACRQRAASEGVGLVECMESSCGGELDALDACVTPVVAEGRCDDALTSCGADPR
jgi:hypothetical protein